MKLVIGLIMLTSLASAQMVDSEITTVKKSFRISSFGDFGSRIFYACDSVENAVYELMIEFGAENITVNCSGGFNPWGGIATEAYVRLSMDIFKADANGTMRADYTEVKFNSFRSCHLYKEITTNTHKLFDTQDLSFTKMCSQISDRFRLSGKFLK